MKPKFLHNNAGDLEGINYSDSSTAGVTYTYDRRGRKTGVTQSGGSAASLAYNDAGQLISETFKAGPLSAPRSHVSTTGVTYHEMLINVKNPYRSGEKSLGLDLGNRDD